MGDCGGSANAAMRVRRSSMGSVTMVDLMVDEQVVTMVAAANGWMNTVISGSEVEALGPMTQDIVIHAEGSNFTPNLGYRVILQYKFRNGPWLDDQNPVVLLSGAAGAAITSMTYQISSAPFSDRAKLGVKIRIVLQTQITSGTVQQQGNFSVSAAFRSFSC